MNTYDVIIIGGGISGLSAAVELSVQGLKVLLLEQHQLLGGRTYSFIDKVTSDPVDNSQHLMMGCYHITRRYLKTIGTDHLASLQNTLKIDFLHPVGKQSIFTCPHLPAPLHLLFGLLGFDPVYVSDRLKMLKVAVNLLSSSQAKEQRLDQMTADEWLTRLGQSETCRRHLWDVIAIGALNHYPKNVSALMLFRVLRAAFLGKRQNSSLLIPRVGLSDLLIDPAVKFIEAHGGKVKTGVQVTDFRSAKNRITSVQTSKGKIFRAGTYISAVPWYVIGKILNSSTNIDMRMFHSSPIVSIHLWLDRKITDLDFAALLETRIQWLFNKSNLLKDKTINSTARQYISLVISSAKEFIGLSKKQLVEIAIEDLRRVLSQARDAKIVHSLVIKEKRATFIASPGLEAFRPDTRTQFSNLFLAGDWTNTGYPATIEGAMLSGRRAAEMILAE
jgi:squalene-associated FAD-dependent desaturase